MLQPINEHETTLITKLRSHPFWLRLPTLSHEDFLAVLIQRRFLSLRIVNIYELAIDILTDAAAKQTVREILHEEYPRNSKGVALPSHRELLFQDLLHLGATPKLILTTPETSQTQEIAAASYELIASFFGDSQAEIRLIAFMRFWAEVLVSVEYGCLWQRLSSRIASKAIADKPRSEFYYFHMIHDRRNSHLGQENLLGGMTHSEELATHLVRLINNSEDVAACLEIEAIAFQLRSQFYNQF